MGQALEYFRELQVSHGMDEFNGSARQNNIIGIGVFTMDNSIEFSDVSDNAINGVLDNSPTGEHTLEFISKPSALGKD